MFNQALLAHVNAIQQNKTTKNGGIFYILNESQRDVREEPGR